ncbi:facilitated trehalose transporter Tret1-like [Hyposmocoma kahamanoa]|uniref:facilitated trehalose transporter Tret1-like n=1 Tax=Hyposmocoma kahamanoa TaxID=1477025 RepID=UPI000E6D99CE|nr:facilitated trehalose transporter Tret1-like [Hyposmocoma kahamanoa]
MTAIYLYRNRIERTASKRWRGSVRRIVSALIYNLSCFTHGCSTGWVSGVLGNEALTGGAWLAALPCLVALPAAPFFAVLADAKGRKAGAFCICISFIINWALIAWCGPRGVWAARVAAGAGGAGALSLAPLYCAEIAPKARGLAAMPALACSCGILFAYGAGGVLSPHALSLSMAVPSAVLLVSLLWLPETPSFLISIGRIQDAAKVMCWFDGSDFREDLTDVIEQQEVRIRTSECHGRRDLIRRQDSDTFQPMLKRISGLDSNSDRKTEPSACRELFRHRRCRRALFSCCVLICVAAGSGVGAVNSFAAAVLRHSTHAVPQLNVTSYNFSMYNGTMPRSLFQTSEAGSMLCGTALVLGAAMATVTVDKVGRKTLLLWSCSGIACCLAILGVYCDPRLRLYTQRIWPYKRLLREKTDLANITYQANKNIIEVSLKNITEGFRSITDMKAEGFNETSFGRFDTGNNSDVVWSKYGLIKEEGTIWAPIVLLSMTLFFYNIGLGSVPFVLVSEFFSINVRSLASSLVISWMWLSNFLLLRYYGTIAVFLGLHGTYYISALVTLLGSLYTCFIIPETKGKSNEQIEEALERPLLRRGKRKTEEP